MSTGKTAAIEASGLTPLDYMLSVLRDEKADARRRDDMAKAAAPYVHPRMAPAQPGHPDPEFIPLAERIKFYARRDAIEAGDGNAVVERRSRFRSAPRLIEGERRLSELSDIEFERQRLLDDDSLD